MFAAHYPYAGPPPQYGYPPPRPPPGAYPPGGFYGAAPVHAPRPADFSEEKPEVYRAFEQMAVQSIEGGVQICLPDKMCLDRHVADFLRCLECWLWRRLGDPRATGSPWRLRCLDLSRNDLSDESARAVLELLRRMDVRVDKIWLKENKLQAAALRTLTEYVWACPEAISELDLEDNEISLDGSDGSDEVSALLRCLYNHSAYPMAQARKSSSHRAKAVPVVLKLKGNFIKHAKKLLKKLQVKGGKDRVRICKDAAAYTPAKEYLSLYAPDLSKQRDSEAPAPAAAAPAALAPAVAVAAEAAPKQTPEERRSAAGGRGRSRSRRRRKDAKAKAGEKQSAGPEDEKAASAGDAGASLPWRLPAEFDQEEQRELEKEVYERLGACDGMPQQGEGARDMLSEFTVCMVQARKDRDELKGELELFLGAQEATAMLNWLTGHLQAKYGSNVPAPAPVKEKKRKRSDASQGPAGGDDDAFQ